ncbi:MAG: hypothetical protein AAF355_01180 [Myxococcota bacterium]
MSTYKNSGGPLVGSIHEEFEGVDLGDARLEVRIGFPGRCIGLL